MTFQQTLETFKTELKAKLKVYFQNELKNSQQANSNSYELLQAVEKMTLHNGKRLRAFLAFLAYNLYADKDPERFEEVFTLGCSLEVFQTFCLIHDDIMDEATTRRGLPTIESLYLQNLPEGLSRERRISLARSTAILAGDMAFALSNSVFNKVSKKWGFTSSISSIPTRLSIPDIQYPVCAHKSVCRAECRCDSGERSTIWVRGKNP